MARVRQRVTHSSSPKAHSAIARAIRSQLGESAYQRYKKNFIIPPGLDVSGIPQQTLQAAKGRAPQTRLPATPPGKPAAKAAAKAAPGRPSPFKPGTQQAEAPQGPALPSLSLGRGVSGPVNHFLSLAQGERSDASAYEHLRGEKDHNKVSDGIVGLLRSAETPAERDYLLASLGRIRGAVVAPRPPKALRADDQSPAEEPAPTPPPTPTRSALGPSPREIRQLEKALPRGSDALGPTPSSLQRLRDVLSR